MIFPLGPPFKDIQRGFPHVWLPTGTHWDLDTNCLWTLLMPVCFEGLTIKTAYCLLLLLLAKNKKYRNQRKQEQNHHKNGFYTIWEKLLLAKKVTVESIRKDLGWAPVWDRQHKSTKHRCLQGRQPWKDRLGVAPTRDVSRTIGLPSSFLT